MKNPPRFQLIALFIWVALIRVAVASPADYVYTPSIEQGEREIDVKYGSATPVAGNSAQAVSLGLGYGVTEDWFSEVYLKRERNGAQNVTLTEWENKFQLTETGKYPIDIGLIAELEAPLSGRAPWSIRLGPLFQTETGKFQLNGNLLFDRAFGMKDESGVPFSTNIGYQWQAKYRWQPTFEYGMQGMGEMGKWDSWYKQADQNHRIGPAVFGKFALGNRQAIKYNAAWLLGLSPVVPNHTFRMQVEYEF